MTEYKIIEHMSYDWMVVTYFFFGGISAGSYIFSVIANYWKQEFKPLAKTGAIIAPVALAIGMLFLLADLGQPFRFWRLFTTLNPTSALSWGVWFLNIFFVFSALYAYSVIKDKTEEIRKIAHIGLPFAVLVGTYTGLLLTQAPGRALWHSPLIPILFLLGGLISGIALVMLVSVRDENTELLGRLGKIVAGLLAIEVAAILIEMLTLFNGGVDSVSIATSLLIGSYSTLFLFVEIFAGAVIPLYILLRTKPTPILLTFASFLILIGIYTMRYIVVIGGQVQTF